MSDAASGVEFLENLRKESGKQHQTFDAFSSYLQKKAREQGVPLYGEFELTPLCNLSCRMCFVHLTHSQLDGRKLLTTEQWKELIFQAFDAGMIHATLTGGECLTYPEFREIFLYLHSLGCEVSVFTNGVLLDREWVEFFKQHTPAEIQITLYGDSDETYERVTGSPVFSQVTEHIRMLQEADLPVRVCVTPSVYIGKNTDATIETAHRLYKNLKINSNLFTPKKETGRSGQEDDLDVDGYIRIYRKLASLNGKELKEIDEGLLPKPGCSSNSTDDCKKVCGLRCGGGRSSFSIDWQGGMLPCNMLDMLREYPLKDGFGTAWQRINQRANNWPRPADCEECAYLTVCNTCAAYMQQFVKPGERPDFICRQTRKLVSAGVFQIPECM